MPPIRGYSSPCMSFVPFDTIRHAKGYHFYSSRVSKRSMMFHVVSHKFQHALRMYVPWQDHDNVRDHRSSNYGYFQKCAQRCTTPHCLHDYSVSTLAIFFCSYAFLCMINDLI